MPKFWGKYVAGLGMGWVKIYGCSTGLGMFGWAQNISVWFFQCCFPAFSNVVSTVSGVFRDLFLCVVLPTSHTFNNNKFYINNINYCWVVGEELS